MLWKCTKEHRWTASFDSIKNKRLWCPYCLRILSILLRWLQLIKVETVFQINILMVHLI
ncbi:hypothetical protein GLOIN_2v1695602 [Rhizophagus irregularis DAOM 181602=DAOM 197198]|uniref:Uncharacterized protein n=1 Tax=Rhizophagus irregularis (strain DAOM 181602 / DAOM 197198 / MUCL 43194) TaxID=747089 RepID=A0A2P4PAU9_RHIID|nr:hypothetical protein GLOIN_2v1729023 [Rhizophagus irregularis DAOM 181602=DAOM 197198]XP_025169392.1 hypothetical protein GLOIN_2v1695602 [Rhizophagus irregularis DAOM 181602=DAOM 197198]POG58647.1 hypothetical protein GLOIN_2v1729023 [Rhizophagus irregularis DAOM 181602=DAOM 197198]POG62526.1 hypothetical protein GLOIN_2v1695602 [Rhizophagus irregularis DAOM 181602=DAOM 197198]|eukprot:XP_025165513.1 hypothetical protein GLOIN_2v1729023 [Rhizophagus irregularis DAOM 181602=DAOM 197198]